MTQQVLFPGWNNFSLEQKSLAKKWIKSILKLRVVSKDLLDSFSNLNPLTDYQYYFPCSFHYLLLHSEVLR